MECVKSRRRRERGVVMNSIRSYVATKMVETKLKKNKKIKLKVTAIQSVIAEVKKKIQI